MREARQVKVMIKQRRTIFEDGMPAIPAPAFEFITSSGQKYFEGYFFTDAVLGGAANGGWLYNTPDGVTIRIELMWSEDLINWTSDIWLESPTNGQVIEGLTQYRARSKHPANSVNKISTLRASGPRRGMVYNSVLYPPSHEDYPSGVGPMPNPIATQILTIKIAGTNLALAHAPYQMPAAAATLQADLVALGYPGSVVSGGTVDGEQWEVYIPSVYIANSSPNNQVTFPSYLEVNSTALANNTITNTFFAAASINTAGIRTDLARQFVRLRVTRDNSVVLPGDITPPNPPVIPNPDYAVILSASEVQVVVGGQTTLGLVTSDRVEDVTTDTVVTTNQQLTALRIGSQNEPITYTSSNPAVATVDASGLVSYVSPGNVNITAAHGPYLAQVDLTMRAPSITPQIRIYKRGADGSARLAAEQAVDSRLAGKTKAAAVSILSTINSTTFVRNANCWANGLIGITGISPWNESGGNVRAVTAITPRHITMATHYQMDVGKICRFVAADNTVHSRTLIAKISLASTDITIGVLDSDLPASIEPVRMLPVNWQTIFPTGLEHIPALCLDFEEKALVTDCASFGLNLMMKVPSDAKRLEFYEPKIGGDSGNPALLVINGQLAMVTQWWFGGPGSGPFLPTYRSEIVSAMTTLGAYGHTLTDVSLT